MLVRTVLGWDSSQAVLPCSVVSPVGVAAGCSGSRRSIVPVTRSVVVLQHVIRGMGTAEATIALAYQPE